MKSDALKHLITEIEADLKEVYTPKHVKKTIRDLKKLIKLEVEKNMPKAI